MNKRSGQLTTSEMLDVLVDRETGFIPMKILWDAYAISLLGSHPEAETMKFIYELSPPITQNHAWLLDALQKPRFPHDPLVNFTLKNGGRQIPSGPDRYEELLGEPTYPYHSNLKNILARYAAPIGELLNGADVVELCTGKGELIPFVLSKTSARPHQILANDFEGYNLKEYVRKSANISHGVKYIHTFPGDFRNDKTWISKKSKSRKYFKGNALEILRKSEKRTICVMFNTATNFPLDKLLTWMHGRFKPGTVFIMDYCNETRIPKLEKNYNSLIIPQWIVTGVTCDLWRKHYTYFDPREIGGCFTATKDGINAILNFNVFEKRNPEETMRPFEDISRTSRNNFNRKLTRAGFTPLWRPLTSTTGDRHALYVFCHSGEAENLKLLAPAP